jgi:hypothetical protein
MPPINMKCGVTCVVRLVDCVVGLWLCVVAMPPVQRGTPAPHITLHIHNSHILRVDIVPSALPSHETHMEAQPHDSRAAPDQRPGHSCYTQAYAQASTLQTRRFTIEGPPLGRRSGVEASLQIQKSTSLLE